MHDCIVDSQESVIILGVPSELFRDQVSWFLQLSAALATNTGRGEGEREIKLFKLGDCHWSIHCPILNCLFVWKSSQLKVTGKRKGNRGGRRECQSEVKTARILPSDMPLESSIGTYVKWVRQRKKCCMVSRMWNLNREVEEAESRMVITRAVGWGK